MGITTCACMGMDGRLMVGRIITAVHLGWLAGWQVA